MWQAFFENSTDILHDTIRCPDVGVHRGGWGEVTMRAYASAKRETFKKPKDEQGFSIR
jgi:hypothetical protein